MKELQRAIGSSTKTSKFVGLLCLIGERLNISIQKVLNDDKLNFD